MGRCHAGCHTHLRWRTCLFGWRGEPFFRKKTGRLGEGKREFCLLLRTATAISCVIFCHAASAVEL